MKNGRNGDEFALMSSKILQRRNYGLHTGVPNYRKINSNLTKSRSHPNPIN